MVRDTGRGAPNSLLMHHFISTLPVVHHPAYAPRDMPEGHRFPMGKFARVAEIVSAQGLAGPEGLLTPTPASHAQLSLAHDRDYVSSVLEARVEPKRARRIGFPMIASVARRSAAAVGGTLLTARLALQHGAACNTAGGSHHADQEGGAGFCVFNDVAVAAHVLLAEGAIRSALVIDLDVHQGDGTARIFAEDPRVFTFSMHCAQNWPHRKAASDWDEALPKGTGDAPYLERLAIVLPGLLAQKPDVVFYNAGVDPHEEDKLGLLSLSDQGLAARDRMVAEACVAAGIPIAGVLGGGYTPCLDTLARRHSYVHQACAAALSRAAYGSPGAPRGAVRAETADRPAPSPR